MTTQLSEKEIKERGLKIKKEDTVFMKGGKLDVSKLEDIASTSGTGKPPYYQYEDNLSDNIHIYVSGDSEDGYGKNIKLKKDPFFEYGYNYYPSGALRIYGTQYPNFFKKGIWYWYDKEGNIEKYEDFDAPYIFTWENVLEFIEEQKIKKEELVEIHRSNLSGKHLWYISFKPQELLKTDNIKVAILDGKTGELISAKIIDVSRQLD